MHTLRRPAWLALAAFISLSPAVQAQDKVLATVNGKPVTEQMLNAYAQQRAPQNANDPAANNPELLLQELVNRELLYQDALKQGLEKQAQVKEAIELQRREVLINAAVRERLEKVEISEEALRARYDEMLAATDTRELKARHILLESEDEARAVIAQLDKGGKFAELAKEKSTDRSAGDSGDLGWFHPAQMVPEFSRAANALDKGQYTRSPVQTQFGWHVILLEDTRKITPPSYEQVKPRLQQMMLSEQVQQYVESLRAKAKVKVD